MIDRPGSGGSAPVQYPTSEFSQFAAGILIEVLGLLSLSSDQCPSGHQNKLKVRMPSAKASDHGLPLSLRRFRPMPHISAPVASKTGIEPA